MCEHTLTHMCSFSVIESAGFVNRELDVNAARWNFGTTATTCTAMGLPQCQSQQSQAIYGSAPASHQLYEDMSKGRGVFSIKQLE